MLAVAGSLLGGALWAVRSVQADVPEVDLVRIGEETGLWAAPTSLAPDCVFDDDFGVYLCPPPDSPTGLHSDPGSPTDRMARSRSLATLSSDGLLFIPDSINKRIMTFSPITGDLIDANFIVLDADATGTIIHAILSASGTVLISDQTGDVVHEYALDGTYLGVFAPAGGVNVAILDNIRGIAMRPNGNLLVSVASGTNADAIAEFDTAGNYLGNFVANGSGGLDSPFDVYQRAGTDWLVSSISTNHVKRYQLSAGSYITNLATISSFPQQILEIANDNVLVANFSGTSGIYELTAAGALVGVYTASGVSGYRGVYELPCGNLLTATSGGVLEISRAGNLVATKYTGQSRFIEFVQLPSSVDLSVTVGTAPSECALTDVITVGSGTAVTYCYEVTNTGLTTMTRHDLLDSRLGVILNDFLFSLTPEASVFLTQTAVLTQSVVNSATWTAYNPGPADVASATDSASVTVQGPMFEIYLPLVVSGGSN